MLLKLQLIVLQCHFSSSLHIFWVYEFYEANRKGHRGTLQWSTTWMLSVILTFTHALLVFLLCSFPISHPKSVNLHMYWENKNIQCTEKYSINWRLDRFSWKAHVFLWQMHWKPTSDFKNTIITEHTHTQLLLTLMFVVSSQFNILFFALWEGPGLAGHIQNT